MKKTLDFIAIDFETATGQRTSICEVGICVVRYGEIAETRSWLVQPEGNRYSYWNMQCHGIRPEDTELAPSFAEVWQEIATQYIGEGALMVAHNVPFDRSCLEQTAQLYSHFPSCSGTVRYAVRVRSTTTAATRSPTSASNYPSQRGGTTAQATMPRCAPEVTLTY